MSNKTQLTPEEEEEIFSLWDMKTPFIPSDSHVYDKANMMDFARLYAQSLQTQPTADQVSGERKTAEQYLVDRNPATSAKILPETVKELCELMEGYATEVAHALAKQPQPEGDKPTVIVSVTSATSGWRPIEEAQGRYDSDFAVGWWEIIDGSSYWRWCKAWQDKIGKWYQRVDKQVWPTHFFNLIANLPDPPTIPNPKNND